MVELAASKKKLYSIVKRTIVILILLVLLSLYYESAKISLGVLLGGTVSLVNILVIGKVVENIFKHDEPSKMPIVVGYVVKITLLFGMVYAIATYGIVDMLAFVIGFSAFIVSLFLETLFPSPR